MATLRELERQAGGLPFTAWGQNTAGIGNPLLILFIGNEKALFRNKVGSEDWCYVHNRGLHDRGSVKWELTEYREPTSGGCNMSHAVICKKGIYSISEGRYPSKKVAKKECKDFHAWPAEGCNGK